jgi:beta-glucosidase
VANNQETNRTTVNAIISERALREIYLKGFEIAVKEAQPWTVMSSYNKINGVYASQRHDLLTSILRGEWGFEGFVMTDWFAGDNAVEQMKAGNDLLMPGIDKQREAIKSAIEDGSLSMDILNQNVGRILNIYTQTLSYKGYKPTGNPDLENHKELARKAAAQGMVLLDNKDNALPLNKNNKTALFGVASYETLIGGTGSGDVNNASEVSLFEGSQNNGMNIDENLANTYLEYIKIGKENLPPKTFFMAPDQQVSEKDWTPEEVNQIAERTELAVYTIGRTSGEFQDRKVENDFLLNDKELNTIKLLSKAYHSRGKKLVVILNIGGVIETASWKELADAILLAWQPGQEAGNAITDVLTGKVNPSGKLTMTFPVNYEDHKSSENFPGREFDLPPVGNISFMEAKPAEVKYEEGIFVGYRHFETNKVKTSYPFGYGLSYTTFDYSKLKVKEKSGGYEVSCTIKNTGSTPGKEVVQLYISAPQGDLQKPVRELKAFSKTGLLKPGEKETVTFSLSKYDLASYHTESSAWIAEAGTYKIQIGASVEKIEAEETLISDKDVVVSDVENQFEEVKLHLEEKEKEHQKTKAPSHEAKVYREIKWSSPEGFPLTMDIHVPQTGKESYPVLVVYHGGGWLVNDQSIMEELSAYISTHAEYIVCNVNYRLLGDLDNTTHMNEIIEDAFGALLWIKENIAEYGGNPEKVAVTGDSAGGHLATSVVNMGRNLGKGEFSPDNLKFHPTYIPDELTIEEIIKKDMLKVQAAIISYGAFDIFESAHDGNFESKENAFWSFANAEARGLFGSDYSVGKNPELYQAVSPFYNIPEAGEYQLPPQLFTVGSEDDLTTPKKVKAYVEKLKAAGQKAELWIYEGQPHAFLDSGSNEFLGTSFEKDAIKAIEKMIEFLDGVFYSE